MQWCRVHVWLALVPLLGASSLPAAPVGSGGGGSAPGGGIPQPRRLEDDVTGAQTIPQRSQEPAFRITGAVRRVSGAPLGNILVKLFTNGVLTASTRTDGDGSFAIEGNPQVGGNNTTILWFESPNPEELLDAQAVLAAGRVARERKLFPDCVQKVKFVGSSARIEVQMVTQEERKAILEKSKCLEETSTP